MRKDGEVTHSAAYPSSAARLPLSLTGTSAACRRWSGEQSKDDEAFSLAQTSRSNLSLRVVRVASRLPRREAHLTASRRAGYSLVWRRRWADGEVGAVNHNTAAYRAQRCGGASARAGAMPSPPVCCSIVPCLTCTWRSDVRTQPASMSCVCVCVAVHSMGRVTALLSSSYRGVNEAVAVRLLFLPGGALQFCCPLVRSPTPLQAAPTRQSMHCRLAFPCPSLSR